MHRSTMEKPETTPSRRPTELESELAASLAARRELGPEMEDEVVASFLSRLEQHIDQRVAQQVAQTRDLRRRERRVPNNDRTGLLVTLGSLGIAVPLIEKANLSAGAFGTVMVLVAVVLVNALYSLDRWFRG